MSKSYTLKEIKDAINKHNKDMNNDIKVKITNDGIHFSSMKAEKDVFNATLKPPLPHLKKAPRQKKTKEPIKGQTKIPFPKK